MFTIIQSHRTERLVDELLTAYKSKNQPIFAEFVVIVPSMVLGDWLDKSIASQAGISTLVTTTFWGQYQWTLMQKVLDAHNNWLENDFDTDFANHKNAQEIITVPEVAVLTGSVMQWRLFGYFTYYQAQIMSDDKHPLYPLLSALLDAEADRSQQDVRLWSLATDFARVFSRYLTHREDWLTLWSDNKAIDVEQLIAEKDRLTIKFDQYAGLTPEWLVAHYAELEAAQRHLWRLLFASVYEHRSAIETRFWQIMKGASGRRGGIATGVDVEEILPTQLHIFTIQQLPQNELTFLQKLSTYIDITLLHYNPSQLFWADIVDKQWLQRQQVINPESVFLRDYGHTLLSRLGKQSRETFAMLASLSGNEDKEGFVLDWQDKFELEDESPVSSATAERPLSLLAHLQQDVLMLDERATQQATAGRLSAALGKQMALDLDGSGSNNSDSIDHIEELEESEYFNKSKNSLSKNNLDLSRASTSNTNQETEHQEAWYSDDSLKDKGYEQSRHWQLSQYDNSLSIHSCHNLQRQLEVLRGMIGRWLNERNHDGSSRHLSDIVVLLPDVERHHDLISSVFVQGEGQDGLTLPAKVTGVVDKSIRQLWEAISGFYGLLGSESSRFEAATVFDWLMLPPLYESLGLTHEQMSRACDLLEQAGFVRGFDEAHLQQTLDVQDYDYRFSFAYALDQIALGLVMPEAEISDCLYPEHWQNDTLAEKTVPISAISLDDAPIVEALCRIYDGLHTCRDEYQARYKAEDWLERIENHVIHNYFAALDQTRPMRAIFNAMNGFKSSLRANRHYQRYRSDKHAEPLADTIATNSQALDAAQVESQLSRVSTLPLKLSFMLDSIEDELESQQVSAEPTGVITFGRFGALRNVPFGLVVMLNMDLAEFPNRDRDNRYDLMKAGLARRGDRFSEDDDNGAFLDALLCARDACWIFYNGQRLTDNHEHLPANPVSELLQFLQGEVQWQWQPLDKMQKEAQAKIDNNHNNDDANENDDINNNSDLTAQVQRYLPKLIEQWLVTRHPALPFAEEVFVLPDTLSRSIAASQDEYRDEGQVLMDLLEQAMQREKLNQQSNNAPARVWQQVFERLQAQDTDAPKQSVKVQLPSKADYAAMAQRFIPQSLELGTEQNYKPSDDHLDITQVDMQHLYYQVRHPAKHFLKEQQVHIVLPTEEASQQEPLALSGLGAYAVNKQLLTDLAVKNDEADENKADENNGINARAKTAQNEPRLNGLLYNPVMPAGVARQATLHYQQLKLSQQCQDFAEQLAASGIEVESFVNINGDESWQASISQLLTPCAETMITVPAPDMNPQGQLQIKGVVPAEIDAQAAPRLWLSILPNSARTQHLLRFWLAHVYWQVARRTTEAQVANNDGRSVWRFNKGSDELRVFKGKTTFIVEPIAYDTALAELLKWVRFAHIASNTPITLLPVYALIYLNKVKEAQDKDSVYQPKRSDFDSWLWNGFNSDVIYDTCSQHELWQYILQNQNAFNALSDGFCLARPLFGMMSEQLKPL